MFGNWPCQTVEPVVVDMEREEVTTGLNFWFRGKPQSLALLFKRNGRTAAEGGATGQPHTEVQKCVSSCLLMLDVIATNETSTTVTPSSTATVNRNQSLFSLRSPLLPYVWLTFFDTRT